MISQITTPQLRFLHKLLRDLDLLEAKESLCLQASGGRTGSVKELTFYEAQELIKKLNNGANEHESKSRMQRAILSMAHQLGWKAEGNPTKVDMQAVNVWCTTHGYLHKPLNAYTATELPKLVQQFRRMYLNYFKK